MPNSPPITGQHEFNSSSMSGSSDSAQASALAFIAERAAGIEWQLAQLNEKLFQILARLTPPTNP